MAKFIKGEVAIVGIGEVPTGKFPDRPALVCALESMRQAIQDAGIRTEDIDVVIPTGAFGRRQHNTNLIFGKLVEEMDLLGKAKCNVQIFSGGSSSSTMLDIAAGLICAGMAEIVLCSHSDALGSQPLQEMVDLFATLGIAEEWEIPYGFLMNATGAMFAQRYMYETGCTPEQMASVCVALRKWAELNPNARYRKPLTIEEVLNSRMIVDPLHSLECNVFNDGGAAFIVTSAERGRKLTDTPVYLLGTGGVFAHYSLSQEKDLVTLGIAKAAKEAYETAGIGPEDIDIAELYDAYPVMPLISLEQLGLCPKGEAGRFVYEGNTWPGGKMPMTTNGGMLSQGHSGAGGGVALLVEAVRQLMGKAGQRQVEGARFAVESSHGGTFMDTQVTILGREIP